MDNKQKNAKVNKILYLSLVVLLCAAAVIAAIATTQNRAKRNDVETTLPANTTAAPEMTRAPLITKAPETTSKPSGVDLPDTTVPPETTGTLVSPGDGNYDDVDLPAPALPTFTVPVKGSVAKGHDNMTAVYSATMDDWRVHLGLDIACALGTDVSAAADGTVSQVWDDPLMGKCVSISHTGTGLTIYKNLDPELSEGITAGAKISSGDVIGTVGESAIIEIADEPHLHFELTVGGVHVDPMEYLDPASVSTSLNADVYE